MSEVARRSASQKIPMVEAGKGASVETSHGVESIYDRNDRGMRDMGIEPQDLEQILAASPFLDFVNAKTDKLVAGLTKRENNRVDADNTRAEVCAKFSTLLSEHARLHRLPNKGSVLIQKGTFDVSLYVVIQGALTTYQNVGGRDLDEDIGSNNNVRSPSKSSKKSVFQRVSDYRNFGQTVERWVPGVSDKAQHSQKAHTQIDGVDEYQTVGVNKQFAVYEIKEGSIFNEVGALRRTHSDYHFITTAPNTLVV